ncbi:MAG: TonB-dependent receptor plug domain-containing protein [Casimicrobium sp.]
MNQPIKRLRLVASAISIALTSVALAQAPAPTPAPAPANELAPASEPSPSPVPSPAPGARTDRVERVDVTGKNDATDERRNASAAKIIITREELEQFGDTNLGEAMRRLPGVTTGGRPGRPGAPQMRGLGGGFTQILIDGQRIPPGFSVQDITPDQVERIEILRAPTAETGARAIAGTINIILREPLRKTDHDIKLGASVERDRISPNASWSYNGLISETGTYTLTGSVNRTDQITTDDAITRYFDQATDQLLTEQRSHSDSKSLRNNYFFSPRAQWRLGAGEQFGLQAFLAHNLAKTETSATLEQPLGTTPAQPYATRLSAFDGRFDVARINANLNRRINEGNRYELRAGVGRFWSDNTTVVDQFDSLGARNLNQISRNDVRDLSWSTSGKLITNLASRGHTITSGYEYEAVRRDIVGTTLLNGTQQLGDVGTNFFSSTQRLAAYAQDDWDISPEFAANLGIRFEEIRTKTRDASAESENVSRVTTPLGHLVWRFAAPSRDQIRLSLTQSYRSPNIDQLTTRPSINSLYPASGGNIFSAADSVGNPNLKPERANGIDLAFERYLKSGGVMSVNFFVRDIKDVIRNITELETVSWSPEQRYVTRPQNIGKARATGIEFDTKFQLRELFETTIPLSLRLNANVYDSKVDSVPGPYNTLESQARVTGNLGFDYRVRNSPLSFGGNFAWTPAYTSQRSEDQINKVSTKRVFDAYALYRIDSRTNVRFSLSNIAPVDSVSESTTFSEGLRRFAISNGRTDMSVALRLEMRL